MGPAGQMEQHYFLGRVESVRGLAALCVALYHGQLVLSLPGDDPLYSAGLAGLAGVQAVLAKCLLIPFNGPGAVALFFVISGWVLGLSLDRRSSGFLTDSARFLLQRVLRIYPAFFVALLIITAGVAVLAPHPPYAGASQWFNTWYRQPLSISEVFANLVFLDTGMNNVTWTLRVELEMAVLFPLLHLLSRRLALVANVLALGLFAGLCAVLPDPSTLKWAFAFYAGLLLPQWGPWFATTIRTSAVGAGPWMAAMLVVFGAVRSVSLQTSLEWAIPLVEILSGAMLLACVVHWSDQRWLAWLDSAAVRKVGRISYSFYVLNFFVLYVWGLLFLALVPGETLAAAPLLWNSVIGVVACCSSLPLAAWSYRWIERPWIECGRRWTRGKADSAPRVELARAA